MTLDDFLKHIDSGESISSSIMYEFMMNTNDETMRTLWDLNNVYHTQEEIRDIFSKLVGYKVDDSFRLFPPFYSDFGKNIKIGKGVFINSCCSFQDQGGIEIGDNTLIGHGVVFATLNHDFDPDKRHILHHKPIKIGKNVWIGSKSTILLGVTINDGAIVAAGSVVNRDVPSNSLVGGVPAKFIKHVK